MKINQSQEFVCNMFDKENYDTHKGLALWVDIGKGLQGNRIQSKNMVKALNKLGPKTEEKSRNYFQKDFFKVVKNSVFWKIMENVRNHKGIKLVTINKRKHKLTLGLKYHKANNFLEKLLAIEMNKANVKIKITVYLGLLILDISKLVMYGYWSNYVKPKYRKKAKLCYTDAGNFTVHVKSKDIYGGPLLPIKRKE